MTRNRLPGAGTALLAIFLLTAVGTMLFEPAAGQGPALVPTFEWDPDWPRPLPEKWAVGPMVGVAVDDRDHIWVIHRRSVLLEDQRYTAAAQDPPIAECCVPAPPILEFDREGNLLSAWGGPGAGYEWPQREHGLHVDADGHVWTAGNGPDDAHVLKFTRDGTFVLQIGRQGRSGGNGDTRNLQRAADMKVDPATNELYVADGYGNRRVIVFDADTGAFKRMWGGFGNPPDASSAAAEDEPLDATGRGPDQFTNPPLQVTAVHCVTVADDGLVYVCDRDNRRIQVFALDGTYRTQLFINRAAPSRRSASRVAFSPDAEQRYLYVADFNSRVVVVERRSLAILDAFGGEGGGPGQFRGIHHLATDSSGNLYVAESNPGSRVQKFVYRGLGPASGSVAN